jgi:hypothetical protein
MTNPEEMQSNAPPPNSAITIWNSRSGILDFGNVVISEVPLIRKFKIKNHSSFKIQTNIKSYNSTGITNITEANELIEKTITGLPIISVRPESISIEPNAIEEIEVIFRPDRYRVYPYREDFQIIVGETDEILHLGVIGRVFLRQYNLLPVNGLDEMIYFHNYNNNVSNSTMKNELNQLLEYNFYKSTLYNIYYEDKLQFYYHEPIRKMINESKEQFQLIETIAANIPTLIIKFPNPYDSNVLPESYVIVDNPAGNAAAAPAKGKAPAANAAPAIAGVTYRKQIKKLKLLSAKSGNNSREVATPPGSFEIIFPAATKDVGIFTVNVEKGVISNTKDEILEIACTQPKPRTLGGVPVGSWKTFDLIVSLKGGYFPTDQSDENKVGIKLMAFDSI